MESPFERSTTVSARTAAGGMVTMTYQCSSSIVEQNLTSALVLEDDADWDVRIKSQMEDFARASRLLTGPGQEQREYELHEQPLVAPTTTPFGDADRWDLMWLGHCGSIIPNGDEKKPNPPIPTGRVVMRDDETVPEKQHIRWEFGGKSLGKDYPDHTRIVSRAKKDSCIVGYALSQRGARRLLYEMGVNKMWSAVDIMMRHLCDGFKGHTQHTCYSVQPPLFAHHRPAGNMSSWSEIGKLGSSIATKAFTHNVRQSTKVNFEKLVVGDTDYIDQWRDGEKGIHGEASLPVDDSNP